MTTITPEAEAAREAARDAGGQFGAQEHTAPEANLAAAQPHEQVLSDLFYVHGGDSVRAENLGKQARLESFVADAQKAVPNAAAAKFAWDHDFGDESRLVFDSYLDERGYELPLNFEDHPDVTDFDFFDNDDAARFGFDGASDFDGATLRFSDVTVRDEAKARAELTTANYLRGREHEQELRTLIVSAMNGDEAVPAERLERLTGYDLEQIEGILASALSSAQNYLRHS